MSQNFWHTLDRFRALMARKIVDVLLRGRTARRFVLIRGHPLPRSDGEILCVGVRRNGLGQPHGLFVSWQPHGMSITEIRNVPLSDFKYDRKLRMWTFYEH